jgi:DNA-binding IclR family transcriptional regulator
MSNTSPVRRLLGVLDLLIEIEADVVRRPKGITVQQAAAAVGASRSSANRIMSELLATGYAIPNPGGRGYRVGPAIQIHQRLSPEQRHLSELAHPYLVRLVDETGECAHTAVAAGNTVNVIDDAETDQALRVVAGRGRSVPLHCTSAGKALLAFGAATLPDDLPARTINTITGASVMEEHLEVIRHIGHAVDDEENDIGVRCISAPVFSSDPEIAIGCIGIDGPSARVSDDMIEEIATSVVRAARELSDVLAGTHERVQKGA